MGDWKSKYFNIRRNLLSSHVKKKIHKILEYKSFIKVNSCVKSFQVLRNSSNGNVELLVRKKGRRLIFGELFLIE